MARKCSAVPGVALVRRWAGEVLRWFVRWYEARLVPVLPLPLFLAVVLAAVELSRPEWLEPAATAAIRVVLWMDGSRDWLGDRASDLAAMLPPMVADVVQRLAPRSTLTQALLGELEPPKEAAMEVMLVALTPDAYARYLHRSTPVPRARLACIVLVLSERLREMHGTGDKKTRPVVAIDIDVAPVEATANANGTGRPDDELECENKLDPEGWLSRLDPAQRQTELMALALGHLADHARVVVVAYPRPTKDSRELRNAFIDRMCCDPSGENHKPCVRFASPTLVFAPEQPVYEYATQGPGPRSTFPGLGQAMADLWLEQRPPGDTGSPSPRGAQALDGRGASTDPYCKPQTDAEARILDDRLVLDPTDNGAIGQFEKIAVGRARTAVTYFDVEAVDKPSLHAALTASMSGLPPSPAYVLTVDSGTTEDKFAVPVVDAPVPGAWIHAAIAVTEVKARDPSPYAEQIAERMFELLYWLLLALFYSFAVHAGMTFLKGTQGRNRNPVWHDFVAVVLPPVFALAFLYIQAVCLTAPKIAKGDFAIPALLLLGMLVETYLGAHTEYWDRGRQIRTRGFARGLQLFAQWLWAAAIATSLLYLLELTKVTKVTEEFPWSREALVGVGLLLGAGLVWAGYKSRLVPLPWRS